MAMAFIVALAIPIAKSFYLFSLQRESHHSDHSANPVKNPKVAE
jgi:hypothetical protein